MEKEYMVAIEETAFVGRTPDKMRYIMNLSAAHESDVKEQIKQYILEHRKAGERVRFYWIFDISSINFHGFQHNILWYLDHLQLGQYWFHNISHESLEECNKIQIKTQFNIYVPKYYFIDSLNKIISLKSFDKEIEWIDLMNIVSKILLEDVD
jgi:hypothetical protein